MEEEKKPPTTGKKGREGEGIFCCEEEDGFKSYLLNFLILAFIMLSSSFLYICKNRYMSITFILILVLSLNAFLNIEI